MENKLDVIFDQMPIMVHSIDNRGLLTYVNKCWLDTLGYTKEEVLGVASIEFLTEASREFAVNVTFPLYRKQGYIKDIPYEFLTKEGKTVYVFLSASSVSSAEGEFNHSVAISTNLTSLLNLNRIRPHYISKWIIDSKDFNTKLIELRKNNRYSQEKMANILNVSTRTYQRLEQGSSPVTVDYISTLSNHFNFCPSLFFIDSGVFNSKKSQLVLIVDNEISKSDALAMNLAELGCQSLFADSAEEALALLKTHNIDILITDILRPSMSGLELIKEIEKFDSRQRPEIYICSSEEKAFIKERAPIADNRIITKPVDIKTLKSLISL